MVRGCVWFGKSKSVAGVGLFPPAEPVVVASRCTEFWMAALVSGRQRRVSAVGRAARTSGGGEAGAQQCAPTGKALLEL